MKKSLKQKKGITLIALVVTIIVLLILAGISIQMLTGDNGILKRTGETKDTTVTKNLKEEIEMIILQRQINRNIGQENKTLKEDIENGIRGVTIEEIEGYTDVFYVQKDNGYVTVYVDEEIQEGKAEIWDGKKISCPEIKKENNIWNWYIYTPSQLKFLADFVNTGDGQNLPDELKKYVTEAGYKSKDVTMSEDTTIYLMNNLDMGARQIDGELIVGKSWNPIGTDYNKIVNKLGTFEGNDNCIRGVYVKTNTNFNGFFGNSNTILRLTIKDSYIEGESYTGGITGSLFSGKIENCHNINTKIKTGSVGGGITGFSQGIINYCSSNGNIEAEKVYIGGIVGNIWVQNENIPISNCVNNGIVEGKASCVGGIVGYINKSSSQNVKITNCTNNGMIIGKLQNIGGIVGHATNISNVSNCNNSGNVIGSDYVGGISGQGAYSVSNCNNKGAITGINNVGGIAGWANNVSNCNNSGTITGKNNVDGIAGYIKSSIDCIDNGKVNKLDEIEGI